MARTTDGRRRGKKTGGEGPRPPRPAAPRHGAEEPAARPARPRREEPRPERVSREEPPGLPAEAVASARPGRIALPSAGLAEDILAMADAAQITAEPAVEGPLLAATTPAGLATTAGDAALRAHNISFFAAPVREERKAVEPT